MTMRIEETLFDLIKTYSPTGEENEAVERFCGYLEGFHASNVHMDAAGNAIGVFPGTGLDVALCGHIDTVPGELPVEMDGHVIKGRGAVDAKSSLISLLYGAAMAKERGFTGNLSVIAAVGEEGPGKGIIEITQSHPRTDYAILGEPSGTTGITTGYRGRLLIDAFFETGTYHASAPWLGENAVEVAIESWNRVRSTYGNGKDFSNVSVALTSIHAGDADNMTPSKSSITLDVRFPPSRKKRELFDEIRGILDSGNSGVKTSLNVRSDVDPYVSNMKTPLVKAFKTAIQELSGEQPKMIFKSGSGDMNILGSSWEIPCITYGPGNPQLSHTNAEVIDIEEVKRCADIVSDALLRLEKLHHVS